MNCEVEFLAVGESSRAGDAIVVRYGTEDAYELIVVDGGTEATGETLVAHLGAYFPGKAIQHVVLTHCDNDHASGLRELFRKCAVANLWMHIPWLLAEDAISLFDDKTISATGLREKLRAEYPILEEIVNLAVAQGTKISYPFAGTTVGPFTVLSPNRPRYLYLLPQFHHSLDETPGPDKVAIEQQDMWIGKSDQGAFAKLAELLYAKAQEWVAESWAYERLKDGGVTSANNESSVVLYANTGTQRVLLTGDAGLRALWWSIDYAQNQGLPLQQFSFVQIPHHGSRRNVGPTVLDVLLGPKLPTPTNGFSAFVSAPKDDSKHPRLMVTNAFMRRGARVIATQGTNKIFYGGFQARQGYSTAEPMAFATQVEEYT